MPGALLIRFDQTDPDSKFYLCRSCQAHIVLSRDFRIIFADHGLTGRVFDNVVNVHIFSPDRGWKVGDHTVTDVYCVQCCNILGVKIIQTPENEAIVKGGDFVLYASKLRMWNGHEVVDE